jgi:hypothetical protein
MQCPHCQINFHADIKYYPIGTHGRNEIWAYVWVAKIATCPSCSKPIVFLEYMQDHSGHQFKGESMMAYPKQGAVLPAPVEVPASIARDFNEASAVLEISPQASAALSRRCLQHILADKEVSTSDNLSTAINAALMSGLPSYLAENLDAIRNIGNFAAHPQKASRSGEIVPVEQEEASWNLEVLELLFDFYYVQPSLAAARREALNKKLAEIGKSPMKTPPLGA